jgi:high frequency lysogenization protein
VKDKTLALAGIFQAAELVRQAANHGTWSGYAATSSLNSLFKMEADSTEEVFGGAERMRLGIETLVAVLQGENRYADALRYAISLLQVQKKFIRMGTLQDRIGNGLAEISGEGADLPQHEREDLQAHHVAELYRETISKISPRIVVNGSPQYLQNERTTDWIRTLLMAGIRSATLWTQLGGGRFELMFGRKKIIQDAQNYLTG